MSVDVTPDGDHVSVARAEERDRGILLDEGVAEDVFLGDMFHRHGEVEVLLLDLPRLIPQLGIDPPSVARYVISDLDCDPPVGGQVEDGYHVSVLDGYGVEFYPLSLAECGVEHGGLVTQSLLQHCRIDCPALIQRVDEDAAKVISSAFGVHTLVAFFGDGSACCK